MVGHTETEDRVEEPDTDIWTLAALGGLQMKKCLTQARLDQMGSTFIPDHDQPFGGQMRSF